MWEVRAADLTISPVHKAAVGRLHAQRGVALRFPRFVRMRDDKGPLDASDCDWVVSLYEKQVCAGVNVGGVDVYMWEWIVYIYIYMCVCV